MDIKRRLMYYGSMLITDQLQQGAKIKENLAHTAAQKQLYYHYKMIEVMRINLILDGQTTRLPVLC